MSNIQGLNPVQTAPKPRTGLGKSNTEMFLSRGTTLFYGFEGVYYPWFFARLVRSLGPPIETIVTGRGLKQDNFRHHLYVNVDYVDRRAGVCNLLIAVATRRALEVLARTVEEQMQRPLSSFQGVLT